MPEVLCTSLSNGSSCPRSRQSHRYYLISPVPCSLLSYKSSLGGCWRSHTRASYNLPRYFESFLSRRTATTPPPPPLVYAETIRSLVILMDLFLPRPVPATRKRRLLARDRTFARDGETRYREMVVGKETIGSRLNSA